MEILEARSLLSNVAWTGSGDGKHGTAAHNGSSHARASAPAVIPLIVITEHPPGDYLGNSMSVPAVFRRTTPLKTQWYIKGLPSLNGKPFGAGSLDVPITGDFDGDGKTDLALYRPSTAQWFVSESGHGYVNKLLTTFGEANVDVPMPGNYNGTGTSVAVYRPTTGQWFVQGHTGPITFTTFKAGDVPVPGDYDNTGEDEEAVYRPTTGQWIINGPVGVHTISFGGPNDIPVPGFYDALTTGNQSVEPAVWRPGTGQFFIHGPNGNRTFQFAAGDIPAPGDYEGVGQVEAAVYRPSTGQWLVVGPHDKSPRVFASFGGPTDIPTVAPYVYRAH
jgi:hypothetical protein